MTYETGERRFGLLAAGLFAAMFGWTGGWLDLARNDSLFLCLAMLAVYVLRTSQGAAGAAVAGVLISLSFLTKQTGLIIAVPLALWCATRGWRRFAAFAGTTFLMIGGTLPAARSDLRRLVSVLHLFRSAAAPGGDPVDRRLLALRSGGTAAHRVGRLARVPWLGADSRESRSRVVLPAGGRRVRRRRLDLAAPLAQFHQRRVAGTPGDRDRLRAGGPSRRRT